MKDLLWPKGLKKTKHRQTILELFQTENRPLSMNEIQQLLHDQKEQIWLSTIYRVLDSFIEYNVINKINMLNDDIVYYELNLNQHIHYAICMNCRDVIELTHCPMDLFESQLTDKNFKVYGHRMEVFGLCEACQKIAA